ncbi:MAG: hypothetical protein O7E52_20535 [Candidatus Poribacteria bacterium]|nr:hypothetical protein [Candidatus Poribacteria bacterium]
MKTTNCIIPRVRIPSTPPGKTKSRIEQGSSKYGSKTSAEQGVLIGWASTNITPEKPVALAGQFRTRILQSVHDPVTATVLAIEATNENGITEQAIMVSCDLVAIRGMVPDRLRDLVKPRLTGLDVRKLLLNATHTHTAPDLVDSDENFTDLHDFQAIHLYRILDAGVMRQSEYVEFLLHRLACDWQKLEFESIASLISSLLIRQRCFTILGFGVIGNTLKPNAFCRYYTF